MIIIKWTKVFEINIVKVKNLMIKESKTLQMKIFKEKGVQNLKEDLGIIL